MCHFAEYMLPVGSSRNTRRNIPLRYLAVIHETHLLTVQPAFYLERELKLVVEVFRLTKPSLRFYRYPLRQVEQHLDHRG